MLDEPAHLVELEPRPAEVGPPRSAKVDEPVEDDCELFLGQPEAAVGDGHGRELPSCSVSTQISEPCDDILHAFTGRFVIVRVELAEPP